MTGTKAHGEGDISRNDVLSDILCIYYPKAYNREVEEGPWSSFWESLLTGEKQNYISIAGYAFDSKSLPSPHAPSPQLHPTPPQAFSILLCDNVLHSVYMKERKFQA